MGYKYLIIESNGKTLDFRNDNRFILCDPVDGLNPVSAEYSSSKGANYDGERMTSARLSIRTLMLRIKVLEPVDENRHALHSFFMSKKKVRVYYYSPSLKAYIDGFVEGVSDQQFYRDDLIVISIRCFSPYFIENTKSITSYNTVSYGFHFPFSITVPVPFGSLSSTDHQSVLNRGTEDVGCTIRIKAIGGDVVNPVIYNQTTDKRMHIKATINSNDELLIKTSVGEKSILYIDDVALDKTNMIDSLDRTSDWITLLSGDNLIYVNAESGVKYMQVIVENETLYNGV
jgi:phage-related protein (tail protein)